MILVTLEGLPHSGRPSILRKLVAARPNWVPRNVTPEQVHQVRPAYHLFAALMRKLTAVSTCSAASNGAVVLLNAPWLEHLPRHQFMWGLMTAMTRELVASLECRVRLHVMIMLHVPHDETFEQMVCCGNPYWNTTSLADVCAEQQRIRDRLDLLNKSAGRAPPMHPFPCKTYAVECPPFFEENEVDICAVADRILGLVDAAVAQA